MFKNGYKIIFIKEGKFSLKQVNISPTQIIFFISLIVLITSSFFIIFSDSFVNWAGSREINIHRENNKILVQKVEDSQKRINHLLNQLEVIKKHDDKLRELVKLPQIHQDIWKMGVGGNQKNNSELDLNYLLPSDKININELEEELDYLNRLVNLEQISYEEIYETADLNLDKILSYPAIYPIDKGHERFSSKYGYRKDPFSKKHKFHEGNDFSAKIGTSVHSTANGRVVSSKYFGSFGNHIVIQHANGYKTSYGHLSRRHVKKGEKVYRGQKIGEVGNTGRSTAPHLHYEVLKNNKNIDPSNFYFDSPIN